MGNEIRKIVQTLVGNVQNEYTVSGYPGISVRWVMPDVKTSSFYYTTSLYDDRMTKEHLHVMVKALIRHIKYGPECARFRERDDYRYDWGITYFITKPLDSGTEEVGAGYLE